MSNAIKQWILDVWSGLKCGLVAYRYRRTQRAAFKRIIKIKERHEQSTKTSRRG